MIVFLLASGKLIEGRWMVVLLSAKVKFHQWKTSKLAFMIDFSLERASPALQRAFILINLLIVWNNSTLCSSVLEVLYFVLSW